MLSSLNEWTTREHVIRAVKKNNETKSEREREKGTRDENKLMQVKRRRKGLRKYLLEAFIVSKVLTTSYFRGTKRSAENVLVITVLILVKIHAAVTITIKQRVMLGDEIKNARLW